MLANEGLTALVAAGNTAVPAVIVAGRDPAVLALLVAGVVAGLVLLARGFGGYRMAGEISGTAPSRISSIAVGEALVTGTAEPIELTLISPLQSAPCIYYRSRVDEGGDSDRAVFREERAVGFRVRDASGTVRVFPRDARFDVPERFDERADSWGTEPVGLLLREGPAFGPGSDRDAQIAALLTVHDSRGATWGTGTLGGGRGLAGVGLLAGSGAGTVPRGAGHFREARVEPGDVVTVFGTVGRFGDLADPAAANLLDGSGVSGNDPEIVADVAAARAAGVLAATPAEAWGNAAIEGFGIGRPVRAPHLDRDAAAPPPPDPELAKRARDAFEIASDALVLAAGTDTPLLISLGAPMNVEARQQARFLVGLGGALLSIASAVALGVVLTGSAR